MTLSTCLVGLRNGRVEAAPLTMQLCLHFALPHTFLPEPSFPVHRQGLCLPSSSAFRSPSSHRHETDGVNSQIMRPVLASAAARHRPA